MAPLEGLLLWLSLCWIPFGLCYLFLQNLLLGIDEVKAYNKVELAAKILSVCLIIGVILSEAVTAEAIFVTSLITLGLSLCWAFAILNKHKFRVTRPSFALMRENFGYSLRGYAAALFSFVALRLDLLLIQYLLGVEQAGYYSVAVALADALYMLPVTVGTILFPKLSGMSDDHQRWRFTRKVAGIVGLLMGGIAIVASFSARPLINTLYGVAFDPQPPLSSGSCRSFLSVSTLLMNYLASVGMPPVVMYSSGTAALANVGLNFKLIPSFGIQGASVSMTVSAGIMLAIALWYIHRIQASTQQ